VKAVVRIVFAFASCRLQRNYQSAPRSSRDLDEISRAAATRVFESARRGFTRCLRVVLLVLSRRHRDKHVYRGRGIPLDGNPGRLEALVEAYPEDTKEQAEKSTAL